MDCYDVNNFFFFFVGKYSQSAVSTSICVLVIYLLTDDKQSRKLVSGFAATGFRHFL